MTQPQGNLKDPNLDQVLVRTSSLIKIKILFLGLNKRQASQLKFILTPNLFLETLKLIRLSQF
jgi:hypothetical protein